MCQTAMLCDLTFVVCGCVTQVKFMEE